MSRFYSSKPHARTPIASGRAGIWVPLLALVLALVTGSCAMGSGGARGAEALVDPVLSPQRPSRSAEVAASRRFEEAREAIAVGDLAKARTAAQEIVDTYPGAPVSGRALRLLVDVAFAESSWREADAFAERWIRLVPQNDPRVPPLRLLQGESRLKDADPVGAIDRLTSLRTDARAELVAAVDMVRRAAASLTAADLTTRINGLSSNHPFRAALLAARARALYNGGFDDQARASADDALAAGAIGPDADLSRAVLDRRVDEALGLTGPITIVGVLLPKSGPPSLARFGDLIEEGIRAAAAAMPLGGRTQIVVQDDRGTPEGAAAGMRALEQAGAIVVVGPLDGPELSAAVAARTLPIPIISPTAPDPVSGAQNVYTLGASDVEGPRQLARWAVGSGLRRVAILHPTGIESEEEAAAFVETFRGAGGQVLSAATYQSGTTYFAAQMQTIAAMRPDALVLPIPTADIELVAPQITFFGLDTLNIRILGTSGWTRDEVLSKVSSRHTDGVVSVTPDALGTTESTGEQALVKAYEALYRRTLRSPVPAVGYDATALLLEALKGGARTPASIATALERIDDFQGATGDLGLSGGKVVRRYRLVCVQGSTLTPIAIGERPELIDRRPVLLPGEKPPAMEGPPLQVVCPGTQPASGI